MKPIRRKGYAIGLMLSVLFMTGCKKPTVDDYQYQVFIPPALHLEYEIRDGYQDQATLIRIQDRWYVRHEREMSGGQAEFFGIFETDAGYDDGEDDIQDYITFRLIGDTWVRASTWHDNINYYSLLLGGSWSPYQSGTVYGPFYYLQEGVVALNNKTTPYTRQSDENRSIDGGVYSCLVYTLQETYQDGGVSKVATTKLWIEKDTFFLLQKSYTLNASDDINAEEAIEFKVTKFYVTGALSFPAGVPSNANG